MSQQLNQFTKLHWTILEALHSNFTEEPIVFLAEVADELAQELSEDFKPAPQRHPMNFSLPTVDVYDNQMLFLADGNSLRVKFKAVDDDLDLFCCDTDTKPEAEMLAIALNKFFGVKSCNTTLE